MENISDFFFSFFLYKAEMFECTLAFAVFDNAGTYRSISKIVAAMKNSHSYRAKHSFHRCTNRCNAK